MKPRMTDRPLADEVEMVLLSVPGLPDRQPLPLSDLLHLRCISQRQLLRLLPALLIPVLWTYMVRYTYLCDYSGHLRLSNFDSLSSHLSGEKLLRHPGVIRSCSSSLLLPLSLSHHQLCSKAARISVMGYYIRWCYVSEPVRHHQRQRLA